MNSTRNQPRLRAVAQRTAIVCGLCVAANELNAQEALNESFEVDRSRKSRKEAIDRQLYNLKAGPVLMRFDALMGFEFNDNPNLEDDPDEVDFAFRPMVNTAVLWALDARNALSFNLGLGYVKYINNTELDHLVIAPSSELALDIYTGDFVINIHERIAHTQNPVNDPTVSGTGDFGGIENTVGLRVDYTYNELALSAGYDHYNFISTSDGVDRTVRRGTNAVPGGIDDVQDRSAELFYSRAGLRITPAITAGLEGSAELSDYESEFFHDNTQYSVGAFSELQIMRDLKGRIAGGYIHSEFDDNDTGPAPDAVDDFYAQLSLEHQLNKNLSHRLAAGREARAGAESEFVTLWYARYENDWGLNQWSTLHTSLFYENGKERATNTERFERIGAGLGVSVPLSRKMTSSLGYQLIYKESNQANRDYLQNSVTLEFRYAF